MTQVFLKLAECSAGSGWPLAFAIAAVAFSFAAVVIAFALVIYKLW